MATVLDDTNARISSRSLTNLFETMAKQILSTYLRNGRRISGSLFELGKQRHKVFLGGHSCKLLKREIIRSCSSLEECLIYYNYVSFN